MPLDVRIELPDGPGSLALVARCLATTNGDVLSVKVVDRTAGWAVDDFLVAWPSDRGFERIRAALAGLPPAYRVLALRRIVATPNENPAWTCLREPWRSRTGRRRRWWTWRRRPPPRTGSRSRRGVRAREGCM